MLSPPILCNYAFPSLGHQCFRLEALGIIYIHFRFTDGEMGIEYFCQLAVAFPLEALIPIYQYCMYLAMVIGRGKQKKKKNVDRIIMHPT